MAEYNLKPAKTEKKKVDKVVNRPAQVRKKSEAGKFVSMFLSDSVSDIKSYIVMDVIVPTIQDTIINILEMVFHGRSKHSGKGSFISYNSISSSGNRSYRNDYRMVANNYPEHDLMYPTRGDAESVLDALYDILSNYKVVSIADLYDLSDVSKYDYTLTRYGWTDLYGSRVKRIRSGQYILDLPKARPLD